MYLKNKEEKFTIKLNGQLPISKEKLNPNNNFSDLTSVKNDWNKYYLASFSRDSNETLSLVFENNQSFSVLLKYQIGE